MFTKGVVACALSSVLISITLPGTPLVGEAQAQRPLIKTNEPGAASRKSAGKGAASRRFSRTATQQQQLRPDEHKSANGKFARAQRPTRTSGDPLGTFSVSAYTHYRNRRGGLNATATGVLPKVGRTVAVDPRVIPLGSRIYIDGIGERIAEDTGGKIKGKKLDLFLPSVQDCLQFGVQQYRVHLLAKE